MSEDIMAHNLGPSLSAFPATAEVFVILDNERAVSAISALLSAFYAPYYEAVLKNSAYLDLAQVIRKLVQAPNAEDHYPYLKMALNVLIAAVEQDAASPASLEPLAGRASDTTTEDVELRKLLARLDSLLSGHAIVDKTVPDNKLKFRSFSRW
jgi:hypothetical protein